MTTEEEIADIERRLFGMSHGHIDYNTLNKRLLALRAEQKNTHDQRTEQSRKESESQWYKKPLGLIFVGAAGTVLGACVAYLVFVHFGIRL